MIRRLGEGRNESKLESLMNRREEIKRKERKEMKEGKERKDREGKEGKEGSKVKEGWTKRMERNRRKVFIPLSFFSLCLTLDSCHFHFHVI